MGSQFFLSLESPNTTTVDQYTSKRLLGLIREHKRAGSDFLCVVDFAQTFGKVIVHPQFASTFKSALKSSSTYKLATFTDLILEIGAGPTVKHGIENAEFFCMIVQISLLTWAHNAPSLAYSLAKVFEAIETRKSQDVPRYPDILRTIRSIQNETSGFMWELQFTAVEEILKQDLEYYPHKTCRVLPHNVLQTLIEVLYIVQRVPDSHLLEIQTEQGLPTLIIWLHRILGLTIEIGSWEKHVKYGNGSTQVFINYKSDTIVANGKVILMTETKDIIFQTAITDDDAPNLEPTFRHPIEGYGSKSIFFYTGRKAQGLIEEVVKLCLLSMKQASTIYKERFDQGIIIPLDSQILFTTNTLFPFSPISEIVFAELATEVNKGWRHEEGITSEVPLVEALWRIIYALSLVQDLESCKMAPLSLSEAALHNVARHGSPIYAPVAFEIVGLLMCPNDHGTNNVNLRTVALVSRWGWSLCVNSIVTQDPGTMSRKFTIIQGVPSKNGERRECIVDPASLPTSSSAPGHGGYKVVGLPREVTTISSFADAAKTRHMISIDENSFIVVSILTVHDHASSETLTLRLGYRKMQDLAWRSRTLLSTTCKHSSRLGGQLVVPEKTWVFRGYLSGVWRPSGGDDPWRYTRNPLRTYTSLERLCMKAAGQWPPKTEPVSYWESYPALSAGDAATLAEDRADHGAESDQEATSRPFDDNEGHVHVGLTAGNLSLKWFLLANALDEAVRGRQQEFGSWYTKHDGCCVNCAIQAVKVQMTSANDHFGLLA